MITAGQIRAARGYLRWSIGKLSEMAANYTQDKNKLSDPTIQRMETDEGLANAHMKNITAVKSALEAEGIEFLPDNTVRFPK